MTAAPITLEELRGIDLFDGLDEEQLAAWLPLVTTFDAPAETVLGEQGDDAPGVHLLLTGSVRTYLVDGGRAEPVGTQYAPTWIGAIAVLTGSTRAVGLRTVSTCRIGLIEAEDFRALAFQQPIVHRHVMERVAPVMSRITGVEQNRERLASLGTMAAGLAHELNNPAAAARRAAAQMAEALEVVSSTIGHFVHAGIERSQAEQLVELHREAVEGAEGRPQLSALEAADAEDELRDALEDAGAPEPWRLAEPLAAAGVTAEWVKRVAVLAGPATGDALRWVAATLTARGLADELAQSTAQMSSLVTAVKSYAYMDRGDLVEVDLHEGLDTTLVVLKHKLKQTEIEVRREYDRSLPKLTVRGSELNQVWTNLLDNAIDALDGRGTITIRTSHDGACALVEISDDGPGMPAEIQGHVFDSFFTTKEVGRGTGLGLATVWRIVVDRHGGSVNFDSRPGATTFHVWIPFVPPAGAAALRTGAAAGGGQAWAGGGQEPATAVQPPAASASRDARRGLVVLAHHLLPGEADHAVSPALSIACLAASARRATRASRGGPQCPPWSAL